MLRPEEWKVSFAPEPRDIKWVNLKKGKFSYVKYFLVNLGLALVGLFFTTPEIIASQINEIILAILETDKQIEVPSWISSLIPTGLLVLFTSLMPIVIASSVRMMGYNFKSTENYLVLRKTFWYLWIVVLIFPTFGLTTVENLLGQIIKSQTNGTSVDINWECFFSVDISSFYVNYVIFAALVGTALELARIPDALL